MHSRQYLGWIISKTFKEIIIVAVANSGYSVAGVRRSGSLLAARYAWKQARVKQNYVYEAWQRGHEDKLPWA